MSPLQDLHITRINRALLQDQLAAAREALFATSQYKEVQELERQLSELNVHAEALRQSVSKEALMRYQGSGNKHPMPGVEVKVGKTVQYSPTAALAYCFTNLTVALVLDCKIFERTMLQLQKSKTTLPSFVSIVDSPNVAIASDLSRYVLAADVPEIQEG